MKHYGSEVVVRERYMNLAVEYYVIMIHRLMDRKQLGEAVKDSSIFAAKLFMGSEMWGVPQSWKVSGMIVFDDTKYHLVCHAAEEAIYEAFDDDHLRDTIAILQ